MLMDVDLGESLNGAETAKQLLSMQDVPIVFHSAHSEKEFISAVESVASYGYVLKGSGEYVLLSSIQMAFQLHQLHESIRQSAKRLEAVLNNVNDVIFSVTPEGKFTYISANWPEYFALETDTLTGKGFQDLIHEDDLESALDFYNRLLETRSKTVSKPARVLHPDGTWHYFQCSASPILDEQGNVTEVVGVTRDETDKINEQKRSHRLSSERDRLLAEEQIRIYNESRHFCRQKRTCSANTRCKARIKTCSAVYRNVQWYSVCRKVAFCITIEHRNEVYGSYSGSVP